MAGKSHIQQKKCRDDQTGSTREKEGDYSTGENVDRDELGQYVQ